MSIGDNNLYIWLLQRNKYPQTMLHKMALYIHTQEECNSLISTQMASTFKVSPFNLLFLLHHVSCNKVYEIVQKSTGKLVECIFGKTYTRL